MIVHRILLPLALAFAPATAAVACADPPKSEFRDIVSTAPTIFIFQLTSAYYIHESLGDKAEMEYVVGLIKVVEQLKGDASSFKLVKYSFRSCGATRMSVGRFYLATTSQTGPLLQLWGMDQAILDLTLDFYDERGRRISPTVSIVKSIIDGGPVPRDFPADEVRTPLDVYPEPAAPEPHT